MVQEIQRTVLLSLAVRSLSLRFTPDQVKSCYFTGKFRALLVGPSQLFGLERFVGGMEQCVDILKRTRPAVDNAVGFQIRGAVSNQIRVFFLKSEFADRFLTLEWSWAKAVT